MNTNPAKIAQDEKKKYMSLYEGQYPSTGYIIDLAEFIINTARKGYTLLDMGCGHGRAVRHLRDRGYCCLGMDITLAGVGENRTGFTEAPLWKTPFADSQFDYTFSTDVLEHIPPEMVGATVKEIYRITRVETFHCISIVDDPNYPNVHLTIKSIEWWKGQFSKLNAKRVDTHVVNPGEFLLLCDYVNKRRVG